MGIKQDNNITKFLIWSRSEEYTIEEARRMSTRILPPGLEEGDNTIELEKILKKDPHCLKCL